MKVDYENGALEAELDELNDSLKAQDSFEEQRNQLTSTKEHLKLKTMHDGTFIALSRHYERERIFTGQEEEEQTKFFFLADPDGGSSSVLIYRRNFDTRKIS